MTISDVMQLLCDPGLAMKSKYLRPKYVRQGVNMAKISQDQKNFLLKMQGKMQEKNWKMQENA